MWKIFFFFVSSLSKFTFSTSDRILCKIKKKKGANKLNLIQTLRSPPLHKVLVWSSSCTVAHSSKWILYLHIYVLCTTTGNVCLKKRAFCLLNIKCVPASWQRHVSVKKQSTPTQTLLQFRLQSQSYYHYSQPFWILHHHCPIPPPPPPQLLSNNSSRTWTQHPISTGGGMMTNSLQQSSPRLISSTWIETDDCPGAVGSYLTYVVRCFRMWGGADGENLWVASSILIARWARGGRGGGGGREVHSW